MSQSSDIGKAIDTTIDQGNGTWDPRQDRAVIETSEALRGTRIALCLGGGIAATEGPRIARALRRLGAEVFAYVTENALKFIGEQSLEWATAHPVVQSPSGLAEHISDHDLVFVSCATADLLGKVAHGICNDAVTTLIQSALGSKIPVVFAPTMHDSLALSPLVMDNRARLEKLPEVSFLRPRLEEGKHKSRLPEDLASEIAHIHNRRVNARAHLGSNTTPRILLTYGGTRTPIDSVRGISNFSSGRLGNEFLLELYRMGFEVHALQAEVSISTPDLENLKILPARSFFDMQREFARLNPKDYQGIFMLAALSDYAPSSDGTPGKISSSQDEITLNLKATQKLVGTPQFHEFPFRFAAKLTDGSDNRALESLKRLKKTSHAQFIFWNTIDEAFGKSVTCGRIWSSEQTPTEAPAFESKAAVARAGVRLFVDSLSPKGR